MQTKIFPVDAITQVGVNPDKGTGLIEFRQGAEHAGIEFALVDAEKISRALCSVILRMARERGIITARDVTGFELHANLDGASLVLADSLTTESLHLSFDQMRELHEKLGMILGAQSAQPMQ